MVFEHTINRLLSARTRAEQFIDSNIVNWTEIHGLPIVRELGIQRGLTSFAVSMFHVEKTGFMSCSIRWGIKTPDGKPLDLFIDSDTKPHIIEAKFADTLRWYNEQGKPIFRFRVKHPGTEGKNIFKDAKILVKNKMKEVLVNETNRYMESMRL